MRRVFVVWDFFDVCLMWHQRILICGLQDCDRLSFRCLGSLYSIQGTLVFLIFRDAGLCIVSDNLVRSSLELGKSVILKDCPGA